MAQLQELDFNLSKIELEWSEQHKNTGFPGA